MGSNLCENIRNDWFAKIQINLGVLYCNRKEIDWFSSLVDCVSCKWLHIAVSSTRISPELNSAAPLRPHERDSLQRIWRRYYRGKRKGECPAAEAQSSCWMAVFEVIWFNKVYLCVSFFCSPMQFFSPLIMSKILLECGSNGRLTGEADVFFTCHQDAVTAMSKDRKHIGKTLNPPLTLQVWYNTNIINVCNVCTSSNVQETATSSSSWTRPILTRGEEHVQIHSLEIFTVNTETPSSRVLTFRSNFCWYFSSHVMYHALFSHPGECGHFDAEHAHQTRQCIYFFAAWRRHQPINMTKSLLGLCSICGRELWQWHSHWALWTTEL